MYNKRDFFSSDLLRAIPYPIIARPPHHSQGRNFNVIQSETEAKKFLDIGYYLQEIIHKRIEYRMFMFNELIMEANEKVKIGEYADELIRNHRRGWAFKKRLLESIPRSTRTLCTNAATRVHSNWCAIDVCENQDGTPYILEMNSAPGLIERKVDKLAEKFFSTFPNFIVSSSGYENDGPDAMYER
jgi:glutathione synthase/RimK-type ligase-like ATP-grasp enzyme